MDLIQRRIQRDIQDLHQRERGRLLVLTGARQTGKSTLASMAFPDYPVVNLDSPIERAVYERMTPADWIRRFPRAVIDEAQKLPAVFETIKACYDRTPEVRYLLLGSSQILLLRQVRETLAGRVALRGPCGTSRRHCCSAKDSPGNKCAFSGRRGAPPVPLWCPQM